MKKLLWKSMAGILCIIMVLFFSACGTNEAAAEEPDPETAAVSAIAGVLFGITDFAYWLFVTDLGVDRRYVRRGVGRRLMAAALEAAGGADDIIVYTCANENAVGFYEKLGMEKADDVMVYNRVQWTDWTVE